MTQKLIFIALLVTNLGVVTGLAPSLVSTPKLDLKLPATAFSAISLSAMPLVSVAEDYEYGAVSAPGWVLPVGAIFAIATALLPLALRAGDDAQREMAERDVDSFGKRGNSPLDKKR